MIDDLPSIPKHWVAVDQPVSWEQRVENMRRGWFVYLAEHCDLVPGPDCPVYERFELCWHLMDRELLQFWEDWRAHRDHMPMQIVEQHWPPERRQLIQAQRLPGKRWFSLTVAAASPGAALRHAGAQLKPHGYRLRLPPSESGSKS